MAEAWLTDEVLQPGLHVCELGAAAADGSCAVDVFFDASKAGRRAQVALSAGELSGMEAARAALEGQLQLPPRPAPMQPWALFSASGARLESVEQLLAATAAAAGVFLIIEGGQFVRPGVRLGHVQHVAAEDGRPLSVVTASLTPLIFSIEEFLTPDDCSHVIEKASGMMFNSPVINMDKVSKHSPRLLRWSNLRRALSTAGCRQEGDGVAHITAGLAGLVSTQAHLRHDVIPRATSERDCGVVAGTSPRRSPR